MAENQQEAGSFQRPPATLTSKPLKQQQQVFKDTTNQTDSSPSGGYYFNVAQKGKLILPTALWILLVLAGVSFLTLLASLNRTVDTLDTLIEIEQEREIKHRWDHLNDHNNNNNNYNYNQRLGRRRQNQADKLTGEEAHKQHQPESGGLFDSWLSVPSFSGFESLAANKEKDLEAPEISGSFIIASSADGDTQPPAEMIDSMMSQVMQMLQPGSKLIRTKSSGEPRRESTKAPQSASGPLISANIERLTVNLNGGGDDDDANDDNNNDQQRRQPSRRGGSNERQSQPGERADPIVGIMSQLIDSKPLGMPATPLVISLDEDIKPIRHEHKQVSNSPLSNLLLPFGSLPFAPLMEVPKLNQDRHPPRQQQPDDVIIIENKLPKFESLFAMPLGGGELASRHKLGHGAKQSPYELPVGSPISSLLDSMRDFDATSAAHDDNGEPAPSSLSKAKDQAKWDVLANDLADSFLSGAFQQKPSEPANPPEPLVFLNGMPLDQGDHFTTGFLGQVFPESAASAHRPANSAKPNSNAGDLFSMIFGSSSQMPAISTEPSDNSHTTQKPANLEPINLDEMVKSIQKELGDSFVTPETTGSGANQPPASDPTKDAVNKLLISSISPDGGADSKSTPAPGTTKEELASESALSDLFGTMFTMAQFGNEQQRPSSQTGGSSPSGPSSSSSSSSGTNSARETMMCNCTRVSSGSSSSGSSGRQQSSEMSVTRTSGGNSAGQSNNMGSGNNGNSEHRGGTSSGYNSNSDNRNNAGYGGQSGSSRGGSNSNGGGSYGGSNSGSGSNSGNSNWQDGSMRPVGYATYSGRPENAPSAYAVASLMANPGGSVGSPIGGQQQTQQQAPELTIRPNSLLSALNNSTNNLLPRIIKRLNETNLPSFATTTTTITTTTNTNPNSNSNPNITPNNSPQHAQSHP